MCNDHAADCQYNVSSMSALCINCTDNTMGDTCEQCLPQFYQDPTLLLDNPNICIGMSMTGVVSQNCMARTTWLQRTASVNYTLQLFWHIVRRSELHTSVRIRSESSRLASPFLSYYYCMFPLFFLPLLLHTLLLYLTACDCNPVGINNSGLCNARGQCNCKANVDPNSRQCTECADGFWNLTSGNPLGCQGGHSSSN